MELLPELQRLYRSNQFEVFINRYFSITDEYKTMSSIMTEEGLNDYMLNLLVQGEKIIDNDLPSGAAYMLLGIFGRASRIDSKVATHVVASILKKLKRLIYTIKQSRRIVEPRAMIIVMDNSMLNPVLHQCH